MLSVPSMSRVILTTVKPLYTSSGRKCRHESKIRALFSNSRSDYLKPPKKEYLRCRVIRGHKRILRQIRARVLPQKTLNKFNTNNESALRLFEKLKESYFEHAEELDFLSQTVNGPITDGKAKRIKASPEEIANSFNLTYCRSYFEPLSIRKTFYFYVELVFSDLDPEVLCKKFDFKCCKTYQHTYVCVEKWLLMKDLINIDMLLDFGLQPIIHVREIILPNIFSFLKRLENKPSNKNNSELNMREARMIRREEKKNS